ncbi:hypothetical protein C0989_006830 [Termitomyces sp. Mn162]|nr:hypothetical protein C0989_006830 [Termitomyces sp. Mn162]
MAELTGLHQTTEAVSLSLQALLECLPLAPTTPPMPPAGAEQFVSVPSSGFLALAAAEWFVSASGLGLSAPHSKLPCPTLPDVYDGDCKAGEHFLQSCITYIQLSSEAFTLDALKVAWVLSYMKAERCPDDEHVNTWYKVAHEQWQLMELQHELWWMQPSAFPFSHGGFNPQAPSSTPALASPQVAAAPPFMPYAASLHSLLQEVPMDVDASCQWSSTPLLCQCCGKAGHFACYCPQGLEVCYLSALEQKELLIQLLAAQDATGTPSLDAPIAVHSDEVANVLEEVPTESEDF